MILDKALTDNLPEDLRKEGLFCVWKYEQRDGRKTKVLYDPRTGNRAKSNDPNTFSDFQTAAGKAESANYDGIGIGLFGDLVGIDIDHCIDEEGQYSELAEDVMNLFEGHYTEKSPSGTGIHILCHAQGLQDRTYLDYKDKFLQNNRSIGLEVYIAGRTSRFLTLTLDPIDYYTKLYDGTEEVIALLDKYMQRSTDPQSAQLEAGKTTLLDFEILAKARESKNKDKFIRLFDQGDLTGYDSQSEAELALCNIFAFWSNRDPEVIDRLMMQSALYRDKWDRQDYKGWTIEKAISNTQNVYKPDFRRLPAKAPMSECMLERLKEFTPETSKRYLRDDVGIGRLFADLIQDVARYVPQRKRWFVYNGKVWTRDEGEAKIARLCKYFTDAWMIYAAQIENETESKDYSKYVNRQRSANRRKIIIDEAKSEHTLGMEQFDKKPYLFNCRNGTLDFEKMEFREHRASDLLTQMSGVTYDPNAACPRWIKFIDEIFEGDKERARYLQKALGYTLIGITREECFFILFGPTTRNGKGTTMGTYLIMMGDYAAKANPDTIAMKNQHNGSNHSEDVARLAGVRFCNISEPPKNMRLSVDLIKEMTGSDIITARYLYEGSFQFQAQFKIFIDTNYLPSVNDASLFSSSRVKVIPFDRHFKSEEQDKNLKNELTEESNLSGILNWCIEGLELYEAEGLQMPESVIVACEEYEKSNDKVGLFLEDRVEKKIGYYASVKELYDLYGIWCGENGNKTENFQNFRKGLQNHGEIKRIRPDGKYGPQISALIDYQIADWTDPFDDFPERDPIPRMPTRQQQTRLI